VGAGREKLGPTILGTDPLSNDRSKSGLALDDALELEARIALKLGKGVLGAADAKAADEYVQAKLAHAVRKSDVLCTLRAPARRRQHRCGEFHDGVDASELRELTGRAAQVGA
jgi:hypothetical protein